MVALLLLLVLPILEIWAAIAVAQSIGALPTVLALVGLSVLGVVLVRSEGVQVWRRVNEELAVGRPPTDSLLDGLMVAAGGALLIVPGFLTAVPGLLLLFSPTRSLLRPAVARWVSVRAQRTATIGTISFGTPMSGRFGPNGGRWSGPVVDATSHDAAPRDSVRGSYAEVIDVEVDHRDELGPAPGK